jgi:hypothetical protein
MANTQLPVKGRQQFVNQVKKQLAASAAANDPTNADDDENSDDLKYVDPIGKGQMRLYSYFGQ